MKGATAVLVALALFGSAAASPSCDCPNGGSGPCISAFGVCYDKNSLGKCWPGTVECVPCTGCSGSGVGPCRHNNDNTCLPFAKGSLQCSAGTSQCSYESSPPPSGGGSSSAGGGGSGSSSGGGSSPAPAETCSTCFMGTSGPCMGADGACWDLFPGLDICPGGTKICKPCSGCTSGQGQCRHQNDGSCSGWAWGSTNCHPGFDECSTEAGSGSSAAGGGSSSAGGGSSAAGSSSAGGSAGSGSGSAASGSGSGSGSLSGGGGAGMCDPSSCWPGTAGPCQAPDGTCWSYQTGTTCFAGTNECAEVGSTPQPESVEGTVIIAGVSGGDVDEGAFSSAVAETVGVKPAQVQVTDVSDANRRRLSAPGRRASESAAVDFKVVTPAIGSAVDADTAARKVRNGAASGELGRNLKARGVGSGSASLKGGVEVKAGGKEMIPPSVASGNPAGEGAGAGPTGKGATEGVSGGVVAAGVAGGLVVLGGVVAAFFVAERRRSAGAASGRKETINIEIGTPVRTTKATMSTPASARDNMTLIDAASGRPNSAGSAGSSGRVAWS